MKRILAASVTALLASAGVAHAQHAPPASSPPPPPPAESSEDTDVETGDDIVVLANPGDQVRIDRRTYALRDDATAQSTNMFDVLGRIPSVSVAPSGAVTLLGADNVTIQINGQPVPGTNLEQVLRGITGAEVERIEVITNPSAQYSAAASGGIINIITRRRFDAGLTGSVQGGVDTLGVANGGVSANWSRGPWSLSGGTGFWDGQQTQDFEREREIFSSGDTTRETGDQEVTFAGRYLSRLTLGYSPNQRRRMSVSFDNVRGGNDILRETETTLNGAPSSVQANLNEVEFYNDQLNFDFQQDGARPREQLRANSMVQGHGVDFDQTFAFTPLIGVASEVLASNSVDQLNTNTRLEYDRPFGEERFLSVGLAFETSEQEIQNTRTTLVGPATPPDYVALLEGSQQTLAGYGTFQFETGDWTWQPGVRAENYRREVLSGGIESDDVDTRYFPSIHIRRELGGNINVDLSYTSRIQRPGFNQLDPNLRFIDTNRAIVGNPNLEPSLTDAYEANFTYQNAGKSFSLTFYDRISEDVFSPFTEVTGGGVILTTTVNAGVSEQRGLQAILRGPLSEHWRYSANVNLMEREFDVLSGGAISRRNEFEYDGSVSLDYRDADQNAVGADQLQFELRFQGPRHTLQSDLDEFVIGNITWRRKVTDRLYATLMAQDIFSSQNNVSEITTDTYFERTEFASPGARLRFALTYQFGSGPQRPPQDQQQPGGPPVPTF
ncbi:MAG TPA: TonB-dependent receptor [Vitreimonas sp.]|uniref:TonB-dependent receptor plug domain-containing protein n=1 Tax=Vitreimonas sp. TaxID=3069702 RepID=UPI002D36EA97|nr:TonB-dependent receptor [Vitreimonas sp.]HYD88174.1 TonB-dependent receptor [Vitreimonas sp.]